jgi:4'-phosphopantetheinyl transferase EntD
VTSEATDAPARSAEPGTDLAPMAMRRTGQSERYVLQAAALRRRQPLWPAALIGAIAVALVVAAFAVANAFEKQKQRDAEAEAERHALSAPPAAVFVETP